MSRIADDLRGHAFRDLFRDLGWDHAPAADHAVRADGRDLSVRVVAQKRGLVVLHCPAARADLADRRLLRAVQRRVLTTFHEHVLIFTCDEPRKQVWEWAFRRPDDRPVRHREHPFFSANPPPQLLARLEGLRFTLDEEDGASLVDARRIAARGGDH
ncbi:MAG TPA: hypothetical protein VD866_17750 [Urbifossiella sp.]|nr:hypothetical protein [Urbifossiella sp.]